MMVAVEAAELAEADISEISIKRRSVYGNWYARFTQILSVFKYWRKMKFIPRGTTIYITRLYS